MSQPEVQTLSIPVLRVGALIRTPLKMVFAELRDEGCTITWAELDKGWVSSTYYNLEITGPKYALKVFQNWIRTVHE